MAATTYASLVTLTNIIDQIMRHGRNSFGINHEQLQSLQEKATFLVDFLECYSHGDNIEVEALESQITDASHAAEDLIEYKVVDYIRDNQSTKFDSTKCNPFCQRLQEVIEAMDLMNKEAVKITENKEVKVQLPKYSLHSTTNSTGKVIMEGFEDVLEKIMDRLTLQQNDRQVIPISGMGGIGKTTLARYVYNSPYIVKHFDVRGWVTISQEYQLKEILANLLIEFKLLTKEESKGMNESQLGHNIHKHLYGRRYLIVMDDMWNTDVWDNLQLFFPEEGNGSRIMITTRLTKMARHLGSEGNTVGLRSEDQSWNLLQKMVFGQQEECSLELAEIGKTIARNCKGLPLSIAVIAGILSKSNMTPQYWNEVAKEVNSIVSLADDEQCKKVLSLSYKNLPIHLKPCFLYMGIFYEDHLIEVSELIRLWVAEGFLKANKAKSLEEVAEDYLMDLIGRNLIMIYMKGPTGKIKICKIHDLLRDLCLREAKKENFICLLQESSQSMNNNRRLVCDDESEFTGSLPFPLIRSIKFVSNLNSTLLDQCRVIRVLNGEQDDLLNFVSNLVNLRHFTIWIPDSFNFPSTLDLLWNWNLQVLVIGNMDKIPFLDIWEMKELRYLKLDKVFLVEPPPLKGQEDSTNMKYLHTLKTVYDLTFSEGVVKRINNVKKLSLSYYLVTDLDKREDHCLSNLQHLQKLESLSIVVENTNHDSVFDETNLLGKIVFPSSLKKLYLENCQIRWEDMTTIGCLPNLEVLKLGTDSFEGGLMWNPIEDQFLSLRYLHIHCLYKLFYWNAESIHFPVLEHLFLHYTSLEEIPLGIGDIPTLRLIQLEFCKVTAVRSAKNILDEQESQGNEDIKVQVLLFKSDETPELNDMKADNFIVQYE